MILWCVSRALYNLQYIAKMIIGADGGVHQIEGVVAKVLDLVKPDENPQVGSFREPYAPYVGNCSPYSLKPIKMGSYSLNNRSNCKFCWIKASSRQMRWFKFWSFLLMGHFEWASFILIPQFFKHMRLITPFEDKLLMLCLILLFVNLKLMDSLNLNKGISMWLTVLYG